MIKMTRHVILKPAKCRPKDSKAQRLQKRFQFYRTEQNGILRRFAPQDDSVVSFLD